jgi:uncharacterized protein (UPF0276 family)
MALGKPIVVHSVGCALADPGPFDPDQLAALETTFALVKPVWWSDHASFTSVLAGNGTRNLGFLLPPIGDTASIDAIADRIKFLQDRFGLPFAFETGVNYFRPQPDEMPDGLFWGALAERADCGILFDIHNVWCNALNGRQALEQAFAALPSERIWEVHVAGGQDHRGYRLDSHSGEPEPELLALLAGIVLRLPALKAIFFEMLPDYAAINGMTAASLARLLGRLNAIWQTRRSATSPVPEERSAPLKSAAPVISGWPATVAAGLDRALAGDPMPEDDPACLVYADLILLARRGAIVDCLPLTARYLWLALGEDGMDAVLRRYFRSIPPEPFMAEEARSFAGFVGAEIDLPHLADLTAIELAAQRAAITGCQQDVSLGCDPLELVGTLRAGRLPTGLAAIATIAEVAPPSIH